MKNSFVTAAFNTPAITRTENGMKAQKSSMSAVVDLFYKIGASRGKDITRDFEKAYQDDADLAIRIAQWARDVRGGAGERQLFRDILIHLEKFHPEVLVNSKLLNNVTEVGRWDDLLIFTDPVIKSKAYDLIHQALKAGNGLTGKWMPRKGPIAVELRNAFGMTPKTYRKTLVNLTNVVETSLCAKEFSTINYSHVPSLAMSRYMKAFSKNDAIRFVAYREALKRGDEGVKVNASAVYPYDIIKSLEQGGDTTVNDNQWEALPNYMTDANVLPMVDVSGSMHQLAGGSASLMSIDVALSLGLYCADKNKGAFKDTFLTFSGSPELIKLKGSLSQKMVQMERSDWAMNTNLHAAFNKILDVAVKGRVPAVDMPSVLLILSDMQFDECARYDDSAFTMIKRKYEEAGYKAPMIVFWNIASKYNIPVSFNAKGVALVSGFSPAIMKAILSSDFDDVSPETLVRDAVGIDRYNWK